VLAGSKKKFLLCGIYFKVSMRSDPAKGFTDGYYRSAESYRNPENRVCHRTMLNAGFLDMDEMNETQLKQIQKILILRSECSTKRNQENLRNLKKNES
jgi:hypothetical protein